MSELATTYVRLRPRTTGFKSEAETQLKREKPGDVSVQVSADTRPADARLSLLKDRLDSLRLRTTEARVKLAGDDVALGKLAAIDAAMIRLDRARANPKIDLEGVAKAEAQVATLNAQLDRLGARRGGGGGDGGGILNRLAAAGQGGFFGGRGIAIGALGSAAVPLGIAGLGAGASLLTPTVAGTIGGGLFAATTKSALTRVDKVQTQLDAINKRIALTSPTTTTGRAASSAQLSAAQQRLASAQVSGNLSSILAAQQSLSALQGKGATTKPNKAYEKLIQQRQALLNQLTPAEKAAAANTDKLSDAWVHFQRQLAPQSFKAVATGTDILTKGLKLALPLTKATGDEIDHLFKRADKALSDPFWRHFFNDFLAKEAPRAVDALGTSIGNIVTGFAHLSEGWAPLGHGLETDLVNITNRFNEWTQGQGPGAFVALVKRDGPVVAHAIQGIASGLVGIGKGLEPIGRVELQALTPVLDFIGKLGKQDPAVITAVGVAYLGIAGGLKAIAAVKGLGSLGGIAGRAGGKGVLGGILSRAGAQGSTPANPLYVFVVDKSPLPHGRPPGAPILTRVGDAVKRYGPGLLSDVALPIAVTGIALETTSPHNVLPGATVQAANQNPAVMAKYRQLLAQAESQSPVPLDSLRRNQLLAQAIADVGSAAKTATPQVHEATLQIGALNKVEALNPQLAKNLRQENVIVGKSFHDLAASAFGAGEQAGTNLGLGLIAGLQAQMPHATVAGKLLVSSTAKHLRLDLGADWNSQGSVVPKVAKHAHDAGATVSAAYTGGLASGISSGGATVTTAADRILAQITARAQTLIANVKASQASITSSLLAQTGFAGFSPQTNAAGLAVAPTVAGLLQGLRRQDKGLVTLRTRLHREERLGLSGAAEQQILGLGLAQGGAYAASLSGASRSQLRSISALLGDVHGAAVATARQVTGDVYGPQITSLLDRIATSSAANPGIKKQLETISQRLDALAAEVRGAQHKAASRASH